MFAQKSHSDLSFFAEGQESCCSSDARDKFCWQMLFFGRAKGRGEWYVMNS